MFEKVGRSVVTPSPGVSERRRVRMAVEGLVRLVQQTMAEAARSSEPREQASVCRRLAFQLAAGTTRPEGAGMARAAKAADSDTAPPQGACRHPLRLRGLKEG